MPEQHTYWPAYKASRNIVACAHPIEMQEGIRALYFISAQKLTKLFYFLSRVLYIDYNNSPSFGASKHDNYDASVAETISAPCVCKCVYIKR